jgi:hypothetical protein
MFKGQTSFLTFLSGTKLKWEFIDSGDIESINQVLRSRDVGNVVLFIHGSTKGKLIDSNSNELPRTFFRNLSPSIMSINFFSCFIQNIDQYYEITHELAEGKTFHPLRHLSFVETEANYSYKDNMLSSSSLLLYSP